MRMRDAARPGDTVVVPPGTYRESVLVDKSSLTLRGSRGAVIDADGFGNGSVGIAVVASPFAGLDPRVEPNPDRTRMVGNVLLQNGLDPDPVRAGNRAADIVYDGAGTANCFARNVFRTDFPSGITALFPCA